MKQSLPDKGDLEGSVSVMTDLEPVGSSQKGQCCNLKNQKVISRKIKLDFFSNLR